MSSELLIDRTSNSPNTVDRAEVPLEAVQLGQGVVVVLVHLEILPSADEHRMVGMEGGGVDVGREGHRLDLRQAEGADLFIYFYGG